MRPPRRPRPDASSWAPGAAGDSGPPPRGHAEQLPGPWADPPRDPRAWKNRSGQRGWRVPAPSGAAVLHKRRRHAGRRRTECSRATRAGSQEDAEPWPGGFRAGQSFCVQARLVQWFLTVQQFCSAIVKCLGPLDPARTAAATATTGRPRRPRSAREGRKAPRSLRPVRSRCLAGVQSDDPGRTLALDPRQPALSPTLLTRALARGASVTLLLS